MQTQSKAEGWAVKRGTKRYEARWLDVDNTKRRAKTGFTTKRDAERYAKTQATEVAGIRSGKIAPDCPATIDALVDVFLEKHGATVDVATERKLRQQLKHVRDVFGTRSPESIHPAEVADWRETLSAGTRHDCFRAFRQVMSWAGKRGLYKSDPTAGIENPKRKRHERTPVIPFETWAEIEEVAAELDARYRAIPIVAAGTGLRPEELFALHRSDIDRDRKVIRIQRRYTHGVLKEGTKTGPFRIVPFGQKVLAALDAMPSRIDTPILFPAPRGGYIDLDKFRFQEWTPALRAAGIAHRRVYDLRHTYISWSLAADVPVAKVAKMAGTSIGQIEDTYHRFLVGDEERYGSALDTFGVAV